VKHPGFLSRSVALLERITIVPGVEAGVDPEIKTGYVMVGDASLSLAGKPGKLTREGSPVHAASLVVMVNCDEGNQERRLPLLGGRNEGAHSRSSRAGKAERGSCGPPAPFTIHQ